MQTTNYRGEDYKSICFACFRGFKRFKGDTINMIYSTPSCYIKAVNDYAKSHNLDFAMKTDDFIPYASDPHTYWTGYYTSRPNSKRFERQGNNLLQVSSSYSVMNRGVLVLL